MAADSMITPTQLQTPRKTTAWPPCEDLKLPSTFHTVGCYTISRGSCGECYSGDTFHITTWVYIIKDCIFKYSQIVYHSFNSPGYIVIPQDFQMFIMVCIFWPFSPIIVSIESFFPLLWHILVNSSALCILCTFAIREKWHILFSTWFGKVGFFTMILCNESTAL